MRGSGDITVSVVIPVFDDDASLRALLEELSTHAPGEVIVVDGADNPATRALCASHRYVATRRGRGFQLASGARQAKGEVLWFLHADSVIQPGALAAVRGAARSGAAGGCFRFRFTGVRRWYKPLLEWLINMRAGLGIPYGDQGLFFARAAYDGAGGFSDLPLFEEVRLVKAVKRAGCFVRLNVTIGVSCRRWERDGWIRRILANRLLACAYALGVSPHSLARLYER